MSQPTPDPSAPTPLVGRPLSRREDGPLLSGTGRFLADLEVPGALHAVFVRSQVAHGLLRAVRAGPELAGGGALLLTAGDLELPDLPEWPRPGAAQRASLGRPCLARERVRFVGEPVAVVLAESAAAAVDAAEQVEVEVERLPSVADPLAALDPGAPLLFPEHGSNLVLSDPSGEEEDVLAGAEVVVRARFRNQRLAPVPMEPNGAVVVPRDDGRLDCYVSSQAPFGVRAAIARALGRPEAEVHVVVPLVGGGFGAKGGSYPEQLVVAAAAARLGRPVRYHETRSENLLAMTHGRAHLQDVELGALRDGTIVGLRVRTIGDVGAYCTRGWIPLRTSRLMATGPYRIARSAVTSLGVVTNTSPVGPYRGAGRPEATALLERSMDLLAGELEMDPAELRRRNLLRPDELPYRAASGAHYDSGDYGGALERALALAGYEGLRAEQSAARSGGESVALGIGLSTFVEVSGVGSEYGSVRVEPSGRLAVVTGSSPHGQGHETTLSQVVAELFGVEPSLVDVVHSDTDLVARGVGTFGSRSGQLAGSAVTRAGEAVLEKARRLAAHLLEADPADVVVNSGGSLGVAGVPSRSVGLAELAAASRRPDLPPGLAGDLAAESDFSQEEGTFPFGAHLAVAEVDRETGEARLRRLVAVDDCGNQINPTVVAGQVHGGLAQGIAQALYEGFAYDEDAVPLTATLVDYAVPSAADLPSYELGETVTPTDRNPLGAKGIGESGAIGAAAAVQNAVLDALAPYGVREVDMPLTPERLWRALSAASPGGPG